MSSGKIIDRNTTIQQLLDQDKEGVIEALVSINKNFSKLRNPLLRKLLARRVSIGEACRIAGCKVEDFLKRMQQLGFKLADSFDEFSGSGGTYFHKPAVEQTIVLDVRPILNADKDPLKQIMVRINELKDGEYLKIINTFQPLPLINLLAKKGFESYTEFLENNSEVHTWFFREKGETYIAKGTYPETQYRDITELLERFDGRVKSIDVSMLEVPQPLVTILDELEHLQKEEALLVNHRKVPVYLLPHLHDKGFDYVIREDGNDKVIILIYKP